MGQKSSIDKLNKELRTKLIEMLQNPAVTQLEVVELINSMAGEPVVSKSSVNRYKQRMDLFTKKTAEAREVAATYIEKMGADSRNKLGKLANEQVRILVFDLLLELEELKTTGDIDLGAITDILLKVSRSLQSLERAEKLNSERTAEIKAELLAEVSEKLDEAAKKKGIDLDTMKAIKSEYFGIKK